jgi:hypothetical protein
MNKMLKSCLAAIVIFALAACTGTQAPPTLEEPPSMEPTEAPSEPTATVAPAPEEPAAAPNMLWSAAYGTDSAEKVQRGIATSDGGILAIGNTDEAGVEVGLPRPGDTLDVSAMDKTVELLYGEYVVGMEATLEAGTTTVAASKYAEDFYWEEYVFWEDNYFGWMREIYDTGWIVENWDDTCEIDEEAGTITYDYTDPDGELVTVVVQYGIVENEETGAVTAYIQEGDKVFILPSGGESRLSDILVIKVAESPGGEIERLWQKTFGTPDQHDVGYQLLELDDGYIIVGGVYVSEDYPQERYIAKLDKDDGSIIWEQTFDSDLLGYDETQGDAIHDIMMSENGYLVASGYVAGELFGFAFEQWGGFANVMLIDPDTGNKIAEYIDIDLDPDENLPTLMQGMAVVEGDSGIYIGGDHGFIPTDEKSAAVSFYTTDGSTLTREWTSYIPDISIMDMTETHSGSGVVVAGHVLVSESDYAPFQVLISELRPNAANDGMEIAWTTDYYNPREFPQEPGEEYIRNETFNVQTVYASAGFPFDGYVFAAGDGDETEDIDETSPVDGSSSSLWVGYIGYLKADGSRIWDQTYYTLNPGEDPGHEACEAVATTSDGHFILFSDSDNGPAPNDFGFHKIGSQ